RELRLRADRGALEDRQVRRPDAAAGPGRGLAHRRALDPARRRSPLGELRRVAAIFDGVARLALIALVITALAGTAEAQLLRRGPRADPPVRPAPADLPPGEAEIWPFPAPDPK